jgi:hypothetical protein
MPNIILTSPRYLTASLQSRYADAVDSNVSDSDPLVDYSEDGVDLTLIRWMLSLTPLERLQFQEARINDILAIRELNARK